MKKETMSDESNQGKMMCKGHRSHGCGDQGAIYGFGVIGALFYFLQGVNGFVPVMIGIGKAVFWPAFVIFKVLMMLQI